MKPIRLIMTGFGPYAEETLVEMNKLGKNGLYLITGDTGAGKTTIFDAITYALYGKASGEQRESSMLRSKYASAETPTEVTLVFSYGDKEYTVKRCPSYERLKKRGEGTTQSEYIAQLELPDGKILTKPAEVDKALIEILGMDKKQFSQIAMIAQGDFLKLLLAGTEDRIKIFQEIFKTGYYSEFQNSLLNEVKSLYVDSEKYKSSIMQYMKGVMCDEDDVLSIEIDKGIKGEALISEFVVNLEKLIENDKAQKEEISQLEQKAQGLLEEIKHKITSAEKFKDISGKINDYSEKILQVQPDLDKAQKKLEVEQSKQADTSAALIEQGELNNQKQIYHEIDEEEKKLGEIEKYLNNYEMEKEKKEKKLKELQAEYSRFEIEKKELESAGENKINLENKNENINNAIKTVDDLKTNLKKLGNLASDYDKKQEIYKDKSDEALKIQNDLAMMNKLFLDEQAGILADSLRENPGTPCPVCGSLTHPHLANKSENEISEEAIEERSRQNTSAQSRMASASVEAGTAKGLVESQHSTVNMAIEQFFRNGVDAISDRTIELLNPDLNNKESIEATLGIIKQELKDQLESIKAELDNIKKDIQRKENLEKLLPVRKNELDDKGRAINEEKEIQIEKAAEKNQLEKNLLHKKQSVKFESEKLLLDYLNILQDRIKINKKNLIEAQENKDNRQQELDGLKILIKSEKESLNNYKEGVINELESEKNTLSDEVLNRIKAMNTLSTKITVNQGVLENINKQSKEFSVIESRQKWMNALSKTANGKLEGKEKIKLETYIQMTYFERIIARANTRFMVMSSGQYELKRREDGGKQKQQGLDLDVVDHYNGSIRDVKTLSGGESFLASLALALGLSDEVQSSVGGIQLGTMFVDEGFGSLDDESLKQAIKTLSELTEGNRTVGIISHVNELKEKIEKRIIVTKQKSGGSTVVVEVE